MARGAKRLKPAEEGKQLRMEGEGGDSTGDKAKKRLKRTQRIEKLGEEGAECLKSKGRGKGNQNFKQQLRKCKNSKEPDVPQPMQNERFIACSKFALDHYNEKKGTEYEFVKVLMGNEIDDYGFIFDFTWKRTQWFHINFMAKPKNAGSGCENIPFFAELHKWKNEFALAYCKIVKNSFSVGCGHCPSEYGKFNICRSNANGNGICHPHSAYRVGRWPHKLPLN